MKINKRLSTLTTIIILQTAFFAYSASAQYKDINSISITAKTLLRNLGVHAADIVSIIVGIVAIVMLVEKPCARDPRSPVPLTLAVQNSLTL